MTIVKTKSNAVRFVAHALLAGCAVGCGRRAGDERFVPSERTAKNALSAVFAAWKAGDPVGTIRLIDPPVNLEVADSGRRRGQQLVEYEILGEVAAEGPRSFAVRLSLAQPREDLEVLYYVVGMDPLFVFRQEDYEMLAHWGMDMPDEAPPGRAEGQQR